MRSEVRQRAYNEGYYSRYAKTRREDNPFALTKTNPRASKALALAWSQGWSKADKELKA